MDYQFPRIECLDDVLPAIEGRDEFIVARREWGTVVNYMVSMADTFPPVSDDEYWCPGCKLPMSETAGCGSQRCPDSVNLAAIRRECRGLLFYPNGQIMSRRLHKFFNVNERDETAAHKIDLNKQHVILEKLDGSMITPMFMPDGSIRWGTKMGITEVSMQAEEFVAGNPQYAEFADLHIDLGQTPIFEWCSRKQRIVVDYPTDSLVLIAIRDNTTGEYKSYAQMRTYAESYGIDLVKAYPGTSDSMAHLIAETRAMEDAEGWIIRFDDGQMLKIKGDWYVRIHKTKDNLIWEKNVVDLLINEKMDDVKPYMLDEDIRRVELFETDFWIGINDAVNRYESYFQQVLSSELDRKAYAQQWMPTIVKQDSFAPQFVFSRFDGKDPRQLVIDQIRKNTGSQTRIDSVRDMWGGAKWTYSFENDS
jgi:RNA ligase